MGSLLWVYIYVHIGQCIYACFVCGRSVAINSMSFLDDDDDGDDGFVREVVVDCNSGSPIDENRGNGVVKVASEETIEFPVNMKSNLDELCMDEPSDIKDHSSRKSIPSQMVSYKARQILDEFNCCKMKKV